MATTSTHTEVPVVRAGRRDLSPQTKFYQHLTAYVLVNVGLFALNYTRNPEHLWSAWVAFGWGIGIVCHAIKVFWVERDTNTKDAT